MNWPTVQCDTPGYATPPRLQRMRRRVLRRLARKIVIGAVTIRIALPHQDGAVICRAKPRGRLDERVEHSLQIERRAADDLEHVGGGGALISVSAVSTGTEPE